MATKAKPASKKKSATQNLRVSADVAKRVKGGLTKRIK
jgi:hypothetical protein